MAYFQMTWTQTAGGNPFDNGGNKLTQTQTTGPFTSPLNLKQQVIPYPPPAIDFVIPQSSINTAPCVVTFTWTAPPIPTPYEVNPLSYTYRVYDNDTNELMTTAQTTSLSGTFTLPSMVIALTTAQSYTTTNINYIGHYFYTKISSTGGGGTSDPRASALSWFRPLIMMSGTVTTLSITILAGVVTIDTAMTFVAGNPFDGGVTEVNFALRSSTTLGGTYSLTDNYDTQTQYGSNVPGQYSFTYDVNYGVPAGKYYKIYSVLTSTDGSKLPSYLSTWSATPFFYNPTMPTPVLIEYADGFTSYISSRDLNVIYFKLTPGGGSPVLSAQTNYTWTLYTSATETGTYTATSSTATFADSGEATTTYNPAGILTFSPPAPLNTWCKLYVIAISTNIVPSSPLSSSAFQSPNKVSTPSILAFDLLSTTDFRASWRLSTVPPEPLSWEYKIYESTTESGTYDQFDAFTLPYTTATVGAFTTTLNSSLEFTTGNWYKLYVIGVANSGNVITSDPGISSAVQA